MELHTLKKLPAHKKPKKRLGRGNGSGKGSFSGKGCKGQLARSGKGKIKAWFEGGQTPISRKMPKYKGFKRIMKTTYLAINVQDLNIFEDNATVQYETLLEKGLIKKKTEKVKILGKGEIQKKVTIKDIPVSSSAQEKIEKAGGKVENEKLKTKNEKNDQE